MSCYGETSFRANGDLQDWRVFRERAQELAALKGNCGFSAYVAAVSDRAWEHILEENYFTPEGAVERLWGFYQTDVVAYSHTEQE